MGLHRKSTISAISSGVAKRPIGIPDRIVCSKPATTSVARRTIAVSTYDGQTQFTRIPCLTFSRALISWFSLWVRTWIWGPTGLPAVVLIPITACFEVTYWTMPGRALYDKSEAMFTRHPRVVPRSGEVGCNCLSSWALMAAKAWLVTRKVPCTFTSRRCLKSAKLAPESSSNVPPGIWTMSMMLELWHLGCNWFNLDSSSLWFCM